MQTMENGTGEIRDAPGELSENGPALITEEENPAIWNALLRQAENGDLRAIKLYYELLEKKRRAAGGMPEEIEQMATIRQAVFGDPAAGAETEAEEEEE